MKIALFIHALSGGGVERSTIRLARHFVGQGHQVDILAFSGAGDMRAEAESVTRVVDLNAPWWIKRLAGYVAYLWRHDPDIVIAATPGPNMIGAIANGLLSRRRPVVLSERVSDRFLREPQKRLKALLLQKVMLFAYRRADAIVAVSRGLAGQVAQIPKVRSDQVHVIYNPVWNPEIALQASDLATLGTTFDAEVPVVISVGRFEEQKDFATLLRAFALLRQKRAARLLLLGDGGLRGTLEALVRDLGIGEDVSMPGFAASPFAAMARADVFVMSSSYEGFGNVLVEAMACGTPVISTDCPFGPAEILDGGRYGPLVPVGDPVALANAIELQLDNPTPEGELLARARHFSVETAATAYLRLAETIAARR